MVIFARVVSRKFGAISRSLSRGLALLGALGMLLPATIGVSAIAPTMASAQTAPSGGACWDVYSYQGHTGCFASPSTACYAAWQQDVASLGINYVGIYRGMAQDTNTSYHCLWDREPTWAHYICPQNSSAQCIADNSPSPPCNCKSGDPAPRSGQPIDFESGDKYLTAEDFSNATGTLNLTRFHSGRGYNQTLQRVLLNRVPIALGNWLFDFQYELQIPSSNPAAAVFVTTPKSQGLAFQQSGGSLNLAYVPAVAVGGYVGTVGYPSTQSDFTLAIVGSWPTNLQAQSTTWTLTDPENIVYTFRTYLNPYTGVYDIARPISVAKPSGVTLALTYGATYNELSSISDNFGNTISFTWQYNSNGQPQAIVSAALPGGYVIDYDYADVNGATLTLPNGQTSGVTPDLLSQVLYLDSTGAVKDSVSYQYNNKAAGNPWTIFAVTGIFDSASTQRWGVSYDSFGRATVSSLTGQASDIGATQVSYTPISSPGLTFTRTVTNPLGKVTTYTWLNNATQGLQLTSVADSANQYSPAASESYTYGADGFAATHVDKNNNTLTLTHDPRGMPIQTVEASGTSVARTTTTTWDPVWLFPDQVVAPGQTTTYSYDSQGRVHTKTLTDTTNFTTPYPTNGRTRTWTYNWGTGAELSSVVGPRGANDTVSFTYNANGYLQTITDQVGHVTTVTAWDWRGAPTSVTDANGVVTTFTYDVRGRPLTTTVNPGASQSQYQFTYDAVGDVSQITLPVGGTLTYVYDAARRLTSVTNVRGETQTFTYDNNGDRLSTVVKTSGGTIAKQQTAAYDELGRLIRNIGASSQAWTMGYDNLDNPTSLTDPAIVAQTPGNKRANAFDPLNRLITQTDPQLYQVKSAYDGQDNLIQLTDARNLATTRVVDGFGEVIQEVSPDRGTLTYWYDADGNLTKRVDGDGIGTDFAYDNANRRTAMTFPSDTAENTTYTYDQTTGGNYGVGRLTSVTEASGSTSFTYDAQGRKIAAAKVISGGGSMTPLTVQYGYDANGKVTSITYPSGDVATYTRATDGQLTGVSFTPHGGTAQSIAASVTYAPYGPLTGFTSGNGLILTRAYDQDYRLTALTVAPSSGSAVINLGFTWQADGRLASVNDIVGNRTPASNTIALMKASLSTTANQVTSTTTLAGAVQRTLTYKTGGDLQQDVRTGAATYGYVYNAAKRLTTATQNGTSVGAYAYDFQGERVYRSAAGAQTAYIFDEAGHLLAEHNATTGAVMREYVWIDDMPVALADISGSTYTWGYIHTGQIDEPLAVTNAAQALAWNGYVDATGNGSTFTTPTTPLNVRLPGQYFQLEPGSLSQNRYRDYDPSLGRYIESDPLGIGAGQSVYGYVEGNPFSLRDPSGRISYAQAAVFISVGAVLTAAVEGDRQLEEYGRICNPWKVVNAGLWGGLLNLATAGAAEFAGPFVGDFLANALGRAGGGAARAAADAAGAGSAGAAAGTAESEVPLITQNKISGDAFRDELAAALRAEGRDVSTEVYKWTPFGNRFIDIEVSQDGSVLGGIETKVGVSRYTWKQRLKDWWLKEAQSYTVNIARDR